MIVLLEIDSSAFQKLYIRICVELQLVVVEYLVVWAGFSFELCVNTE